MNSFISAVVHVHVVNPSNILLSSNIIFNYYIFNFFEAQQEGNWSRGMIPASGVNSRVKRPLRSLRAKLRVVPGSIPGFPHF